MHRSKKIGIKGIDLVGPKDWPTLKSHGLHFTMCNGAEINLVDGFNNPKFHDQLIKQYSEIIPMVSAVGYQNLICFSGNSLSPEMVIDDFRKKGIQLSEKEAEKYLDLLFFLAKLVMEQNFTK